MVFEGLDLGIFHSVDSAENSLEPWWVEEELGNAYDGDGQRLRISVKNSRVCIAKYEVATESNIELKLKLLKFIHFCTRVENMYSVHDDLADIISTCENILDDKKP